jgi:ABC-2 type transport system permease protein
MNSLRVFVLGGLMSYRALFSWQSPTYYIPTMLGHPLFQVLFFAYLGRFSHVRNDAFFVVGNSVQVCAMAAVYGMAMTIGGERWTQTLAPLLATPAYRLPLFLGRALPQIVNGFFVSAFAFTAGWLLLDFNPPLSSVPGLALIVLVSTTSCAGFGLVVGALGLRLRDVFTVANPAYFLMLLLCGVAALDGHDRTLPPADARDRGGACGRRRRAARLGQRPALARGRDRRLLLRGRVPADADLRDRGTAKGLTGARVR